MSEQNKKGPNGKKFTRRDFLKVGALSPLALSPLLYGSNANGRPSQKVNTSRGEAKNIIFMVSDGMSSGTMTLADLVKHRQHGEQTHWINLYNSDRTFHRGLMDMASLDSPVTDSAAAASSWGCGQRINNGAVNMGPDDEEYPTILQIFKEAGKKTGLVSTARITHATPAGFGINMRSRNMEDEIAAQYLDREYDLLMGGGARHFDADQRKDGRDLFQAFAEKNYAVARTKQEIQEAGDERLIGLFFDSHLPYTTDHRSSEEYRENVPTLAEMTGKALDLLENDSGFILQVEGGRVDHGAHANDAAGMIYDQIAFDDAIKVALDFVEDRDDTLLIITTDHGNANPGLNGAGSGYTDAGPMLDRLHDFRHTNTWILSELDDMSSIRTIRERIEYATGIGVQQDEARMLRDALREDFTTPYKVRNSPSAVIASILANYTSVNFIGSVHTADYIELAALGPGIETLDNFTRNTELFDLMVETAGVAEYAAG
ncbi:MAG: alkaline phosphatase [Balneolaceae bacterium]